jgi:hypothetical protein
MNNFRGIEDFPAFNMNSILGIDSFNIEEYLLKNNHILDSNDDVHLNELYINKKFDLAS